MRRFGPLLILPLLASCAHPGQLIHGHRSTPDLQSYNANADNPPPPAIRDADSAWLGDSYVALGAWSAWFPVADNWGHGGDTTGQVLARVPVSVPPTVYVWCGLNDLLQSVPPSQTAADYTALVALLQSRGAHVICLSPLPPGSQFPADLSTLALTPDTVAQLDQTERQIAQQAGAQWIDLRPAVVDADGWCNRGYVMPCGLHLDAAGYSQVVALIRGWSNG